MNDVTAPIPDWLLERYSLGELTPAELVHVREQLERSPSDRARLDALTVSTRKILDQYPAAELVRTITERAASSTNRGDASASVSRRPGSTRAASSLGRRKPWLLGAGVLLPAMGAAAALFVVLEPEQRTQTSAFPSGLEATRIKGDPQLFIHRRRGQSQEQLVRGSAKAQAGDYLQLSYRAADARFGVIVSIDGRGEVTQHFPGPPSELSGALTAQGVASLDHSYEIDDAPSFERFILVTASRPFATDAVIWAARALATRPERVDTESSVLDLPAELVQFSFIVRKVEKSW